MTPLVAQNFGASEKQRLDQIIAYSGRMTVYWGFALYIVMAIFAGSIGSIFTDNTEVIQTTAQYIYIVGLSYPAFGLALITTSFFNGVYQPLLSLRLTLIKSLALTVPFALIGGLIDIRGIWIGLAIANIPGAAIAGRLLHQWLTHNC